MDNKAKFWLEHRDIDWIFGGRFDIFLRVHLAEKHKYRIYSIRTRLFHGWGGQYVKIICTNTFSNLFRQIRCEIGEIGQIGGATGCWYATIAIIIR